MRVIARRIYEEYARLGSAQRVADATGYTCYAVSMTLKRAKLLRPRGGSKPKKCIINADRVVKIYEEFGTVARVATVTGYPRLRVRQVLHDAGVLKPPKTKVDKSTREDVVRRFLAGESGWRIAKELGNVDTSYVYNLVRKSGQRRTFSWRCPHCGGGLRGAQT